MCADVSKLGKNEIDSENVNWLQSFMHIGNRSSEFPNEESVGERMRRNVAQAVRAWLEFFQQFEDVKVYYDRCH